MSSSQNRFGLLIKHASVVVMYLLFLFVQVFFNFDTGRHQYNGRTVYLSGVDKTPAQKHFKTGVDHSPTTKSRLNKRFQPAVSPALGPVFVEPPVVYNSVLTIGAHTDAAYVSVFVSVHTLRGPPVSNALA